MRANNNTPPLHKKRGCDIDFFNLFAVYGSMTMISAGVVPP